MLKLYASLCIAFFCSHFSGFSQSEEGFKIRFYNGQVLSYDTVAVKGSEFLVRGRNGFPRYFQKQSVFSITNPRGKESVFYTPTETLELSVEEMRSFLQGREKASINFPKKKYYGIGFAAGVATGFLSQRSYLTLSAPFIFSAVAMVFKVNPKRYANNTLYFQEGFILKHKKKRFTPVLLGTIAGIVTSSLVINLTPVNAVSF